MTGIPIVILGGSDRRPAQLPPAGRDKHPILGYKGVDIRVGGRRLIELLVQRLRTCPEFDPIIVAGPARIYGGLDPSIEVVDTDSSFGGNIRAAIDAFLSRYERGPLAFTACDILPEPRELRLQLEDFRPQGECDLWFPMIPVRADARLGAFGWKPGYQIVPGPGEEAVRVLPGHLVIADPRALRLRFMYHLMDLAYRTRNRPIAVRRTTMAMHVIGSLLFQDLLHLLSLRVPSLTWTILRNGLGAAKKLRAGTLQRAELEDAVTKIAVKGRHRKAFPERGARLPILDGLTLAEDIDTVEEAEEIDRAWRRGRDQAPVDRG